MVFLGPAIRDAGSVVLLAAGDPTSTEPGSPGWEVLALGLGLGIAAVLLLIFLIATLSAASRSRRGQLELEHHVEIFRLPPPAGLGTTSRAPGPPATPAPAATPTPAPPAPAPAAAAAPARSPARAGHRPHVTLPHVTLPHVTLPHVTLPHLSLPKLTVSRIPVQRVTQPNPTVSRPAVVPPATSREAPLRAGERPVSPADTSATREPATPRPATRELVTREPVRTGRGGLIPNLAAGAVAVVLIGRSVQNPGWWQEGGPVTFLVAAAAVTLAVVGLRWLDQAVQRPRALSQGAREVLLTADDMHHRRVRSAEHLLAGLADGGDAGALWTDFTRETGLSLPTQLRASVNPHVDPDALVRYLAARSLTPAAVERPLWVVTAVPVVACLLPAVVVLAAI